MGRVAFLLAAAASLCACQRESAPEAEVNATNATVAEVAEQVREAGAGESFIRPGKWVSRFSFEEMTAPGMPPGATQRLNEMMAGAKSIETCLAEAESRQPSESFFSGNEDCRYENFTMSGGRIDATMRCTQDGTAQVMQMEGSYSPDSYQLQMTTSVEGMPGASGDMRMRMRIDARRVGECEPANGEGQ